ncbi:hypothetical protein SDC9_201516 [bioreactor metagenome]|uniref:Uncharacterized protein n=1 Tax=bioreactor metagenome TaxID=1076179 RepID=A0A645IR65_9ZZZZ
MALHVLDGQGPEQEKNRNGRDQRGQADVAERVDIHLPSHTIHLITKMVRLPSARFADPWRRPRVVTSFSGLEFAAQGRSFFYRPLLNRP